MNSDILRVLKSGVYRKDLFEEVISNPYNQKFFMAKGYMPISCRD